MALDPLVAGLTGFLDYDRPHFASLNEPRRIDYFEKRVRLVVIRPLRRLLDTEILVPESSAILIFGVSLCCAIEATGKFLVGLHATSTLRFETFVKDYMSREFDTTLSSGTTYRALLWKHFRNGIAHGFAVKHGGFEGNPSDPYFAVKRIAGHDCLEINPSRLYDDYVHGFDKYLAALRAAAKTDPILVAFNEVFESVFIRGE